MVWGADEWGASCFLVLPHFNQQLTVDLISPSPTPSTVPCQKITCFLANTKTPRPKKNKDLIQKPGRGAALGPVDVLKNCSCLYHWATGCHRVPQGAFVCRLPYWDQSQNQFQMHLRQSQQSQQSSLRSLSLLVLADKIQVRPYVDPFFHQQVEYKSM